MHLQRGTCAWLWILQLCKKKCTFYETWALCSTTVGQRYNEVQHDYINIAYVAYLMVIDCVRHAWSLQWVHLPAVFPAFRWKCFSHQCEIDVLSRVKCPARAQHLSGHMTGLLVNQVWLLFAAVLLFTSSNSPACFLCLFVPLVFPFWFASIVAFAVKLQGP